MFLRIRSWSDNHVPVNLHQTNFVLTRKSRSCGTTFNLRDPGLAERSAGGSLRARAPDPIRLHHRGRQAPGTQRSVGSGARAPQASHMVRQGSQTVSQAGGHRHPVSEAGAGERLTAASGPEPGRWAALARALEPCRTQILPVPEPHTPAQLCCWS